MTIPLSTYYFVELTSALVLAHIELVFGVIILLIWFINVTFDSDIE